MLQIIKFNIEHRLVSLHYCPEVAPRRNSFVDNISFVSIANCILDPGDGDSRLIQWLYAFKYIFTRRRCPRPRGPTSPRTSA